MLDLHALQGQDLKVLSPEALAALATQMLAHIGEQARHTESQARDIKWRDAKIESITFQLARLKAWRFGARTEAMTAQQRAPFDETYAADEASLRQQLEGAMGSTPEGNAGVAQAASAIGWISLAIALPFSISATRNS